MRIYLCHNETKSLYAGDGNWVSEERYALMCASCVTALNAAIQLRLENVSILMAFEDRRYDFLLPLDKMREERSARPHRHIHRAHGLSRNAPFHAHHFCGVHTA